MRLLLVNWQDIENPQAGGAEIHLHEIFGRLAGMGHEVVLLCGGWPGCPDRVTLDGILQSCLENPDAWELGPDGHYTQRSARAGAANRRGIRIPLMSIVSPRMAAALCGC